MRTKFLGLCHPPEDIAKIALEVSKVDVNLKRYWWVEMDKKEWAGFSGAIEISLGKISNALYFGPTFVKEEYRGLGIQDKLIKKKIEFAFYKENYDYLVSSIYADSIISGNNLIKNGFKLIQNFDQASNVICFMLSKVDYLRGN